MRSSSTLVWQASVVCLFLMLAVIVGTAGVTAHNPTDATLASSIGTNTATEGQVPTADGNGNVYWADAQTNNASGGGGGSITGETMYVWADSVPLETTNPPAIEYATNTVSSVGFPYMAFDKDALEWVGPLTIVTADNWNSNIVFEIDSWGGATGDVQYLMRLSYVSGESVVFTSSVYDNLTAISITNMIRHTWALTTSGFTSDNWYAWEFASQTTNLIGGSDPLRAGDHRIQQVKSTWVSE